MKNPVSTRTAALFAVLLPPLAVHAGPPSARPSQQQIYESRFSDDGIPHYTNTPQRPGDRLVINSAAPWVAAGRGDTVSMRRIRGSDVTVSVASWRRHPSDDELPASPPPRAAPLQPTPALPQEEPPPPSAARLVASPPAKPVKLLVAESPVRLASSAASSHRATVIDIAVRAAARKFNLDESLIRAVIHVESRGNPNAVSRKGATGLMQLMPGTARRFGVVDSVDPTQNIHGGAQYLRVLLDLFNGDVRLALAAYNAGEGAVLKYNRRIPPYAETRSYVQLVLGRYQELRG